MSPSELQPRIGYVLKMYPRFSETFILNEILALQAQGADLEVFSLRGPIDGRFHEDLARVQAPVTYLTMAAKTSELWETLGRAHRLLPGAVCAHLDELLQVSPDDAAQAEELACFVVNHRIDHLHAHFGSVSTTVARLAARLSGVSYSFTAHAKDIFHEEVDLEEMRQKLADAAAVVTVSDYNVAFLRRNYGASAERVVRIYNGLDLDAFSQSAPADRPPVVAAVGRLVEKKGFCYLMDAIAQLVGTGRRLRLDVVGTGDQEDALRAQVAELGLTETVNFHGPLPQGQTREVIRQASVLAAPCVVGADGDRDGLPTVILEGLAVGTPVVATPVTGIPEAVLDGQTGLLVRERDSTALAAALALLIDDQDLGRELAAAGRRHVEVNFDSRHNAKLLHDLLCDISVRHQAVPG